METYQEMLKRQWRTFLRRVAIILAIGFALAFITAVAFPQDSYPIGVVPGYPNHHKLRDTSNNIVVIHYDSSDNVVRTLVYLRKKRDAYHYIIDRKGRIYQMIDPKWEARHAGISYWNGYWRLNHYSIGICLSSNGVEPFTEKQYQALEWLISHLKRRYPDIDSTKIVGHSDIAFPRGRKKDPGPNFDWSRIWNTAGTRQDRARDLPSVDTKKSSAATAVPSQPADGTTVARP